MSKTQSKSTAKNLAVGGMAGAVEATLMFPTEFVKTQLQLQQRTLQRAVQPYAGPVDVLRRTISERGVLAVYTGLSTLVVGSFAKAAVRFAAFNRAKGLMEKDEHGRLSTLQTLSCGLTAGVCEAVLAVTPMETVKTKLIHDRNSPDGRRYNGLVHGVKTMIREDGVSGIYKGVGPTIARQATNQGIRFVVYTHLKSIVQGGDATVDLAAWQSLGCGSVAGIVSCYCNMPLDVVKTRMQGLESTHYRSSIHCFTSILRKEGVLALWKGTLPRLSRVGVSGGLIFMSYEQIMKAINPVWPEPK